MGSIFPLALNILRALPEEMGMTAHEALEIHRLIAEGKTKSLAAMYKGLRQSGEDDDAKYLIRMAHQANKA